jgi:hypothetical protein
MVGVDRRLFNLGSANFFFQYAGEVFAANHTASRYILLLGAGDASDDIRRAATSKLFGPLSRAREKSKQVSFFCESAENFLGQFVS